MNQVILVGKIFGDIKVETGENDKKVCKLKIVVSRNFKNIDGVYENDLIDIILWNGVAESTVEYCKNGDVIGIKGRLQVEDNNLQVIAEKITFLSSKKVENEENK